MRTSQYFFKTQKNVPKGTQLASHQLLLKGGFVYQTASGSFSLLPLGFRVFSKIKEIIREELNKAGCQEILMPVVQPARLWKESGRYETAGPELVKFKGREDEFVLAMTHEEVVTDIVRKMVKYADDLPFILNQIQTKFRDEPRPRGGLLRLKEFVMQDAYSFDKDKKGLDESYEKIIQAYKKIFKRLDLDVLKVSASSGIMGGASSEEFMVLSDAGEDEVVCCVHCGYKANIEVAERKKVCPECSKSVHIQKAIELGHTFKLQSQYSERMKAFFIDKDGKEHPILMGCYGIGLERLMAAVVEIHHDENGIIWPKSIAPFSVYLTDILPKDKNKKVTEKVYNKLITADIEVLYEDREKSPGFKFAEADLIGCPLRLIISKRSLDKSCIELKERKTSKTELIKLEKITEVAKEKLKAVT
uniref:Proline--tRNA ligase n=1 Tax=candidate division CPR3 bacterium TaxID=2268181 RepID=A0A7V3J8X9_UNCC3